MAETKSGGRSSKSKTGMNVDTQLVRDLAELRRLLLRLSPLLLQRLRHRLLKRPPRNRLLTHMPMR